MRLSQAAKRGHANVKAMVGLWIVEGIETFVFVNVIMNTGCAHVSIMISHDDDEESESRKFVCVETSLIE